MPTIAETMQRLDPHNEDHWTADGLPALEALKQLGGGVTVTRKAVNETAPGFNRDKAAEALKERQAEQRRAIATNTPAAGLSGTPDTEAETIVGGDATQPQAAPATTAAPTAQPDPAPPSSEPAAPRAELPGPITAEEIAAGVEHTLSMADEAIDDPVRAAEAAVLRAQQIFDASRAMVVKLQAEYEARVRQADASRPRNHSQLEISRYHETQNKLRAARAERVKAFNDAGLKDVLKGLGPSKLDGAFARRPTPSDARPALRVPGMVGQVGD